LFVAAIWLLAGIACKSGTAGNQHARPDALIVLPGATDVHETDENQGTVVYQLNEKFPALPVIQTISNKLEGGSWRPLENSFLNPGSSSSTVRRWESYEVRLMTPSVRLMTGRVELKVERPFCKSLSHPFHTLAR